MHGSVVSSEAVLVVSIVDGNLDRHGCVNQTDDGGGHSNEVGVPAIRGTSEPSKMIGQQASSSAETALRRLMGECLDIISGSSRVFTQQHQ